MVEAEVRRKGQKGGVGTRGGLRKSRAGEGPIHQPSPGSSLHSWLTRGGEGRGLLPRWRCTRKKGKPEEDEVDRREGSVQL